MKNLFKNAIRTLSIIAIILTTVLVGVACSNTTAKNNIIDADNAAISSDINSDQTIPVSSDENNQDESEIQLDGIYRYARPITFKDIWFKDEANLYKFFQTRDLNGVYDAVYKLGFEEYYNYLSKVEESEETIESMLYFNDGKLNSILYFQDGSYKIETPSHEISDYCVKIEYDEENNVYLLYRQFCYQDENGNQVETPLYVKVPVTPVANSINIDKGIDYIYYTNSAIVNVNNNNILETSEYISKLATIFGLEANEDSNITMNEIVEVLSKYTYRFTEDFSNLSMFDADDKFVFAPRANDTYSIINLVFNFDGFEHNITTDEKFVNLSVTIEGETKLTFSLIAK